MIDFIPFKSLVFVVEKTINGKKKGYVVVDLRILNKITILDYYPFLN